MSEYLVIVVVTALVNYAVFTGILGVDPADGVSGESGKALVSLGGGVIAVMTASSAAASLLYNGLLLPYGLEYLGTVLYVLVIALLSWGAGLLFRSVNPDIYAALRPSLPWIAGNCAILGVTLNSASLSFGAGVASGFSASVCFAVVLFLLTAIRARIAEEDLPASVRGWPVLLLSGALICMALMGFTALA